MKLKNLISKFASTQTRIVILNYSTQEIIFDGLASDVSNELKERYVVFIDFSNERGVIIDVKKKVF